MRAGWQKRRLGDIMLIERGGSPRPISKYLTDSSDGLNWIKISDATASNKYIYQTKEKIKKSGLHKTRLVQEGDFLLSNSMSFGRPYIMKTSGCIHDGWLVLKDRGEIQLDKDFLYYLLSSTLIYDQFNKLAAGSTVRNLNIALVSSVGIPVPPLAEQQHIVSILDQAFATIDKAKTNLEKNLQNAKELFQSELNRIFTQKGEGWVERKLGEVCSLITDGKHGDCQNEEGSGYYFLSAKDVKNNTLNYGNARQITKSDFEETHRRTSLEPGDVLVTNSGTIGRMAIAPDDFKTFNTTFQKSVAVIKPIKEYLNNRYCCYHLMADLDKLVNVSAGTAQKNLLLGDLRKHIIGLPKTLYDQQKLVSRLDFLSIKVEVLESIYQQKLSNLEELKKSILEKAFDGELIKEEVIV